MAKNAVYTVKYRRKVAGKTNYKKRLDLLKSGIPRLVVRMSNSSVIVQIIEYTPDGDMVKAAFNSQKLESFGWKYSKKSIPACYLAGLALGVLAKKNKISNAILDLGLKSPLKGSKSFACLKGVIDAGISVPASDDIFPSDDRISGAHIASCDSLSASCTAYKKNNLSVKDIPKAFEDSKNKILG